MVRHFSQEHWSKIRVNGLKSVEFLHFLSTAVSEYNPGCLKDLVTWDHLVFTFISLLLR